MIRIILRFLIVFYPNNERSFVRFLFIYFYLHWHQLRRPHFHHEEINLTCSSTSWKTLTALWRHWCERQKAFNKDVHLPQVELNVETRFELEIKVLLMRVNVTDVCRTAKASRVTGHTADAIRFDDVAYLGTRNPMNSPRHLWIVHSNRWRRRKADFSRSAFNRRKRFVFKRQQDERRWNTIR